jgi:hypothetical protein
VVAGVAACSSGRTGRTDQDPSDASGSGRGRSDRDPSDPQGGGRAPGLYRGPGFGSSTENLTLNAYVGLPVDWTTWANCAGGDWNFSYVEISSGALPPGLRIGNNAKGQTAIVGVPERAGTWHLQVRFNNVTCAGKSYGAQTQVLHITTEGSSAPQRVR